MFALRRLNPTSKVMLGLLVALVLVGGGFFAWWTLSPLFVDKTVSEDLAGPKLGEADITELLGGSFRGADNFHQVSGTARVLDLGGDTVVRLEPDFASINGPDLYLWLVKGENTRDGVLDLGKLKGNQGSQNYPVPAGTDLSQYDRVIVWCRAFGVLFGSAELTARG